MSWVLDYSPTKHADRLVLIVLAEHADKHGENAWPAATTIAKRANVSEAQAWRSLANLRACGAIAKTGKHKSGASVYRIEMTLSNLEGLKSRGSQSERSTLSNLEVRPSQVETRTTLNHQEPPLRAPRARDPIWDALIEAEGNGQPVTKAERSRLNAAVKQLRDAGVDPSLIAHAATAYRTEWPGVTLTAHALVANWTKFTANGHAETGAERLRRAMAERGVE